MSERDKHASQQSPAYDNTVHLRGRLTADPESRELPSGDTLVSFRVSVPRANRPGTDWIDCSVWSGRVRSAAPRWRAGDVVEVEGALRRRFFRGGADGATRTRVEIEVHAGRRVSGSGRIGTC